MTEVVHGFDFDIVQGIYDFTIDKVRVSRSTEENTQKGRMEISSSMKSLVVQIENGLLVPTKQHLWKCSSRCVRIWKYNGRGFRLKDNDNWLQRLREIAHSDPGSAEE